MTTPYRLRDRVFAVLNEIYGHDKTDRYPHISNSVVRAVTDAVFLEIAFAHLAAEHDPSAERGKYLLERIEDAVMQTVWMHFAGGTTAEYARDEIMKVIKEEFKS